MQRCTELDCVGPVTERALSLLKTFLPEFIPSDETLHTLEQFCVDQLSVINRDSPLGKVLNF